MKEKLNMVNASCLLIAAITGVILSSCSIQQSLQYTREADIDLYQNIETLWNETYREEF
jgi:hypothetical protein